MKKKILSIALSLTLVAFTTSTYAAGKDVETKTKLTPTEKAVKSFSKEFKNVVPVIYPSADGFILSSTANGHQITSAYDKQGNWNYTINRYPAASLALDIMNVVKENYNTEGYFITTMEKVDQPASNSVFIVHLQNKNSFKTLRVINSEVELVQDFKKI